MNSPSGRLFKWLAAGMLAALATCAAVAAELEPIEHFTKMPAIDGVSVSPSGNRMAFLVFGPEGRRRVGVIDLDPVPSNARMVAGFGDADIRSVRWVNDNRLVFEAFRPGAEIRDKGAATYAVNQDGSGMRQLIVWSRSAGGEATGTGIVSRVLPYGWFLHSTIDDGSDDVFVYQVVWNNIGDATDLFPARLNTATGELQRLSFGMPKGTAHWYFDGKHLPRMLSTYLDGREKVFWRSPANDSWTEVADFDPLKEAGFTPWLIDAEGQIFVTARLKSDTQGVFKFDPITKRLDPEPVVSVGGFDLEPTPEVDSKTGRLMGLHFTADRPMSYWYDAGMQKIQRSLDAALPEGRSNRIYCGRCESTRFFVVRSSSDRQPGEYFLFDRQKASLVPIGASRPWIDEAKQGHRSFHRIATRDGLKMPVYVTHPQGEAVDRPLPAVMLVHGGPWLRGANLGWSSNAQFLASRGYRVIEPEFRGSDGYGSHHFRAGWKQWGGAMQDDLADAVQWAAAQHMIDPKRVCIMGASYGGYAALMSPIAHPGVYRCAVSFAGVTDIDLMYSIGWSDLSESGRDYSMPAMIGDPKLDAELLARSSPLVRVREIKIPVLLVHGGVDRRVPIDHARTFYSAARKAGVSIDKVEYAEEGHGFADPATHADYYGRVERFLEKSLKPAP